MTSTEFKLNRSGELKALLESPLGADLFNTLGNLCPPPQTTEHAHLYAHNQGVVDGYNRCMRNFIQLAMPPQPKFEPEANYGVSDKPSEVK